MKKDLARQNKEKDKSKRMKRMLLVLTSIIVIVGVFFTIYMQFLREAEDNGALLFIPGYDTVYENKTKITHSIEKAVSITKDGKRHTILYGFIEQKKLYIEAFANNENEGATLSSMQPQYYTVYVQGEKLSGSTGHGNTTSLELRLPRSVKKNQPVTISLRIDEQPLTEFTLLPLGQAESFTRLRPCASRDRVMLFADVQRIGDKVLVFLSAMLPEDAILYPLYPKSFAFSVLDIVLDNKANVKDGGAAWDSAYWALQHYYVFDIPSGEGIEGKKIQVNGLSYLSEAGDDQIATLFGPWDIIL